MHRLRQASAGGVHADSVVADPGTRRLAMQKRGAALFRACAACHSLKPDRNMTGRALPGIWERKAGSLASFERYSPALKSSDIVWDDNSLDAWLKSPQSLVPQNRMIFPGMSDAQQRADLIAFLKQVSAGNPAGARDRVGISGSQEARSRSPSPGHPVLPRHLPCDHG